VSNTPKNPEQSPDADPLDVKNDLPTKPLTDEDAESVKGGVGFVYGKIAVEYKPQSADG
jgi:hypothetical protein